MEILPGVGVGKLTYKMNKDEVEALLGKPDSMEKDDIIMELAYYYNNILLRLSFNIKKEYKLDTISFCKDIDNLPVLYKNNDLFAIDYNNILNLLQEDGKISYYKKEYIGSVSGYGEQYEFDSLGMSLTFNNKKLHIISLHEINGRKIKPKIGISSISFKMSQEEVKKRIIAELFPVRIEDHKDINRVTFYKCNDLFSIHFDRKKDQVTSFVIKRDLPVDYKGKNLFTMDYDAILGLLKEDAEVSNHARDTNTGSETFDFNSLGMRLTFDANRVLQIIEVYTA